MKEEDMGGERCLFSFVKQEGKVDGTKVKPTT